MKVIKSKFTSILAQKTILFPLFLFCLVISSLSASPKTLILGGEKGWEQISQLDGIIIGDKNGQFGYDALELSTRTENVKIAPDTDLLLTFDNKHFKDLTGNYQISENQLYYSSDSVKGGGAGVSRGTSKGIKLKGSKNALFGNSGFAGSFTIEFWICPSLSENGENVFSWRSSLNENEFSEYQMISASFVNNRLDWTFNNIFVGFRNSEIHLVGYSTIVPKQWSRHTISFDEESGLLEYLVDGRSEAMVYVTKSGHENGTVCYPLLGVQAALNICSDFVGKIDNFRITKSSVKEERSTVFTSGNEKYLTQGGKFSTKPILISQAAVIEKIDTLMRIPAQTDIRFYIRSGENCYGWTDSYPQWKEIVAGEEISGVSGLYFQLCAEFLPDGNGSVSPKLSQIAIHYEEQDIPLPPFTVSARAGDGCVTLDWTYSVDDNAAGYYVYYGNRPGEYLGRMAVEGASPIRIGNTTSFTLTGLENGRIYYFAVSAYSKADSRINGSLSKEVFARPSSRLSLR